MKKLSTFFLALIASAGTMFAESGTCGENLTWDLTNGVLTISGFGAMNNFFYYNNVPWYSNRQSISQVVIPNSVTNIGNHAFSGCSALTYVTIPNSVTNIGNYAFSDCSALTYVTIPNSVTSIGDFAFYGCSALTTVTIPNSVISIGYNAFQGCWGLSSVTIPNSVTSIGSQAFELVFNIIYSGSATGSPWGARSVNGFIDGNLVYKDHTKTELLGCLSTVVGEIVISDSVTTIGEHAFYKCAGITSVTIPNSIVSVGNAVFYGCIGLTSPIYNDHIFAYLPPIYSNEYSIPEGIESIGGYAFSDCKNLSSVIIPSSVTHMGAGVFYECNGLTSLIMESVFPPYTEPLWFTSPVLITVPCGSLEYYQQAEEWSEYASIIQYPPLSYKVSTKANNGYINVTPYQTICDTVQLDVYSDPGFYFVSWEDGNIENPRTIELTQDTTMEAIFDYLLTGKCGKDSVLTWTLDTMSMSLNITGQGALSENYTYGEFIESLTIGNEITEIGEEAFYRFEQLKKVILGSSVKVLEAEAFRYCSAIETITCYSQRPPTVNDRALDGLDYSTIVYVPADYLNNYQMHDAWGLYDVRPLGGEQGIEDTNATTNIIKLFRDGQILILRANRTYTLTGQEVK